MTSIVSDDFYYDRIFIDGLDYSHYFTMKETPLSSMVEYYYGHKEPNFAKDRIYRALWKIMDNKLFFINLISLVTFKEMSLKESFPEDLQVKRSKSPVLAKWFSGTLTIEVRIDYEFTELDGVCFDRYMYRSYVIEKGNVLDFRDFYKDHLAPPF